MQTSRRVLWRAGTWLARGLRVSAGVVAVGAALGLVAARVSYARATDAGLNFGEELRQLGEQRLSGEVTGDVNELSLNGQPFDTTAAATHRPMAEVLDYFQDRCTHNAAALDDELKDLPKTLHDLPKPSGTPGYMVVRKDSAEKSFIFCVAADHELTAKEKILRMKRVAETSDVGELGDIRYITVLRDAAGCSVTSVWTHGVFNIDSMFPKAGDAPGEDLGGVPRPEGSRRILTGHIVGAPFGVNVYEAPGGVDATLSGLDAKLVSTGWKPLDLPKDLVHTEGKFYSLGNSLDIEVVARPGHDGKTDVSYVTSRAIGTVTR